MAFTVVVNVVGQEALDQMANSVDRLSQKERARTQAIVEETKKQIAVQKALDNLLNSSEEKSEKRSATRRRSQSEENEAIARQVADFKRVRDGYSDQINQISSLIVKTDLYKTSLHNLLGTQQIELERKSGATRIMNEQLLAIEKLQSAQKAFNEQAYKNQKDLEMSLKLKKQDVDVSNAVAEANLKVSTQSKMLADATYREILRREELNKVTRQSVTEQDTLIRKYEELQRAAASYQKGGTPGLVTGSKVVTAPFLDTPKVSPADMALQEQYTKLQKDLLLAKERATDAYRREADELTKLTSAEKVRTADLRAGLTLEEQLADARARASTTNRTSVEELLRLASAEKVRTADLRAGLTLEEQLADARARASTTNRVSVEELLRLASAEKVRTADLRAGLTLEEQLADARARAATTNRASVEELLRLASAEKVRTADLRAGLTLEEQLADARARASTTNRASVEELLRLASAEKVRTADLRAGLTLEEQLADARARAATTNRASVEELLRLASAEKVRTADLRAGLTLEEQLADARARASTTNRASVEELLRLASAEKVRTADLRAGLTLEEQLADARARASTTNRTSVEELLRLASAEKVRTADLRAGLTLEEQLADARARASTTNRASVEELLRLASAEKVRTADLRAGLTLEEQLADARARASATNRSSVEELLRLASAEKVRTADLRAGLTLEEQLADARARASTTNRASVEELLRLASAEKVRTADLRMTLTLEEQLAAAKARGTVSAQRMADEISRLDHIEKVRTAGQTQKQALEQKLADLKEREALRTTQLYQDVQKLTIAERNNIAVLQLKEKLEGKIAILNARKTEGIQKLITELKRLEAAERGAAKASSGLGASLGGVNQLTASMRAGLTAIGAQFGIYTSGTILAAGATYGFINAIKQVITAGKDFQVEIARVNAVMNLNESQIESLKETTIELAASSRYTAKEVAQAFREMGMAGIDYQNSMAGIRAVLSLASIGNMDFAQATDIATNVTFGFGLEMSKLTHVVDVMAKTVTSSNQDIKQLGNTMSYAAPIASSFGVSLELTAAMTEVLANSGIKASRAGTTLRRTFTALFSDTERVTEQLGELGVHVNFLASDMDQELLRVLQELNAATNGATINVGNLTKAVGLYAAPGFLKLVKAADQSKTSLEAIYEATKDVEGAAYEMQKRIEDTLAVDWSILKSALEAVKVMFFELYEKGLRNVVQSTSAWIQGLAANKDLIAQISQDLKVFSLAMLAVFSLIAGSALIAGFAGVLGKIGTSAVAAWKGVSKAGDAVGWLGRMGGALKASGLVATLLAAAGAGWSLWEVWKKLSGVQPVDVGAIRNFNEARSKLRPDLWYRDILEANEGLAIATAQQKLAIEEMLKQRGELEADLDLRWKFAEQSDLQGMIDEIGELEEKLAGLDDKIARAYDDAAIEMEKLARLELVKSQELKVTIPVKLEANNAEIDRLTKLIKAEVAGANARLRNESPVTQWVRDVAESATEFFGITPEPRILDYLRESAPAAADAYKEIEKLKKENEELLATQRSIAALEKTREGNLVRMAAAANNAYKNVAHAKANELLEKEVALLEQASEAERRFNSSALITEESLNQTYASVSAGAKKVIDTLAEMQMTVYDIYDMRMRKSALEDALERGGQLSAALTAELEWLSHELKLVDEQFQVVSSGVSDFAAAQKESIEVLKAEGKVRQAVIAERKAAIADALNKSGPLLAAELARKFVAEDMAKVATQEIRLLKLQGQHQAALTREREAASLVMSEQEYAAWRLAEAAEAEAKQMTLVVAALKAAGESRAALALERRAELKAAAESERALIKVRHAYEDLDAVIEKAQKRQSLSETFREDALALTVEGDALRESLFASGMLEEALEGYDASPVVDEVRRIKDVTGDIMVGMFDDLGTLGMTFAETIQGAFDVLRDNILSVSVLVQQETARALGATRSALSPIGSMPGGKQVGSVLDLIGKYEAPRGYGQMYSGVEAKYGKRDLEGMSIGEVLAYQRQVGPVVGSSAAGKYQFMPDTLQRFAKGLGLDMSTKFDAKTQDMLAMAQLKELGYEKWAAGSMSSLDFLSKLSEVWMAFPDPATGKGRHTDKMGNKAQVDVANAIAQLDAIRAMGGSAQETQEQVLGLAHAADPALSQAMSTAAEVTTATATSMDAVRVKVADAASVYDAVVNRYEESAARITKLQAEIEDLGKLNLSQGLTPEESALFEEKIAKLKTELEVRKQTAELIDRNAAKELQAGKELTRVRKASGQELEDLKLRFNEVYAAQTAHYKLMAQLIVAYKSGAISLAQFNKQVRESALSTVEAEGGWKRYWASLIKGTQSFGDAMIDVADQFRQKLIDSIVAGKLELQDLGDLLKRKLAEITVNNITTLIIGGLTGASGQMAQATAGATQAAGVGSLGGLTQSLGSIGKFFSGLGGNSYGSSIASGASSIGDWFGSTFGSQQSRMLAQQTAGMGTSAGWFSGASSVPNWAYGAGGLVGGLGGGLLSGALFNGKGYSGIGGSLGGAGGAQLGMALGSAVPGIGTIIGGLLGGLLGGASGGALGSLFGGGKKQEPRATLNVEQGYMGVKSTNDAWGDGTELYAGVKQINTALDALSTSLGDAAWGARNAFNAPDQVLSQENAATWMKDNYERMIRAMVEATETDALSQAGGELFSEILGKAFDQAGNDPQAIAAAINLSKTYFDTLTEYTNRALLFDPNVSGSDFDTLSRSIYEMTERMRLSGETLVDTLARITQAMEASTAVQFTNPGFADMQFYPGDHNTLGYDKSLTEYGKYLQSNVDYWYNQMVNGLTEHREIHRGYYEAALAARNAYVWVNTEEEKNLYLVEKRAKIMEEMANKMGGMESFQSAQNAYYELAYSEEERAQKMKDYAAQQVSAWNSQNGLYGDATIDSVEQLRAWMESLDLTTQSGQDAYVSGLRVAEMFGILQNAMDELGETIMSLEDFIDALKPPSIKEAEDKEAFEKIFNDAQVTIPLDTDQLYEMLTAGSLSQAQIDALLANADFILEYLKSSDSAPETRDYSSNSTIRELEQALDDWTGKLDKAKDIFDNATDALHSLKSIKGETETLREDLLQQARAAINAAELPDNINNIISDLGQVSEEDFASYEDFMAAVNENENLLLQLKNRAGTEMNYAQRQVDLLEEQIRLAKEALEQEDITLQKYIEELQDKLLDSELRTQELWADGFGAVLIWLEDIYNVMGGAPGGSAVVEAISVTNTILVDSFAVTDTILVDGFTTLYGVGAASLSEQSEIRRLLESAAVPADIPVYASAPIGEPVAASSGEGNSEQMDLLISEVRALRAESSTNQTAIAVHSRRVADLVARWEGEGIPADREDYLKGILINSRTRVTDPCQ
ncbi:MAG: phage tail tape measure protein [Gammaproteobacteria bacterium]|nr:phage tail tape measure protein [Gammaproteobacteria bacterium]